MLVGSPVSRYRDSATPAMLMDWHEKNAGLRDDDGLCDGVGTEAKALPVMSADRGVGVTVSLVSTPASRSQMIWKPRG